MKTTRDKRLEALRDKEHQVKQLKGRDMSLAIVQRNFEEELLGQGVCEK